LEDSRQRGNVEVQRVDRQRAIEIGDDARDGAINAQTMATRSSMGVVEKEGVERREIKNVQKGFYFLCCHAYLL
jgi:hypothetical protein